MNETTQNAITHMANSNVMMSQSYTIFLGIILVLYIYFRWQSRQSVKAALARQQESTEIVKQSVAQQKEAVELMREQIALLKQIADNSANKNAI